MPRSIWTGAISFGLVTVPVKLYSAVSRKTVRFHQLNGKTGVRIQQKRVDPTTGDEVPYEDIVKGYELTPDRYVLIEPGELEALDPKKTKSIEIEDFVALDDIDPIYYDHPYYLAPGPGGAKPYRLLLEAMKETGRVAIATVVIRSKQQLVAVRPIGDHALGMATMVFPDEVIDADTIDEIDGRRGHRDQRARARDRRAARRVAGGGLRSRQVPRHLPRGRARARRAQGRGRAHRRPAGGRGGGRRGARPHVGAEGEPRRGQGARRQRRLVVEGVFEEEGLGGVEEQGVRRRRRPPSGSRGRPAGTEGHPRWPSPS